MKKTLAVLTMLFAFVSIPFFAREYKYPYQESKISYRNVTIYKVLDQKDAYIVIYSKGHTGVGQVSVPKAWYKTHPQKLSFRQLPHGMDPYMTIINNDGSFDRVILTMPVSRLNPAWGVADSNVVVNDANKDTLEVEE